MLLEIIQHSICVDLRRQNSDEGEEEWAEIEEEEEEDGEEEWDDEEEDEGNCSGDGEAGPE